MITKSLTTCERIDSYEYYVNIGVPPFVLYCFYFRDGKKLCQL